MRPSSLPMLAQCPCWESSGSTADTDAGTARHVALGRCLSDDPDRCRGLSEEDADAVMWAANYVKTKAPTSDHPLELEKHVNPHDGEFEPLFENGGTLDVCCGPFLADLKWRERDYGAQMAAYALAMFQADGWETVEAHVLFGESKRAEMFVLTEELALKMVVPIINAASKPDRNPTPCEYCGWCAKRLTCPALLQQANAVVAGREDWQLEQYHASKIESAAEMGKALRIARTIAEWCDSVEHHAKEMLKKGVVPAGFKVQSRQGNRYITSVADAFPLAGLPQADFLKACDCKPTALFEAYAKFNGQSKASAEKDLTRKLGEVIQRKPSTQSLVTDKG